VTHKRPVLLVGETGTSKTATVSNFLNELDKDSHLLLNVNFSSRTTPLDVQRNLEANIEKRTKDIYGPPNGKRLIVFLDDMNMPQVGLHVLLPVGMFAGRSGLAVACLTASRSRNDFGAGGPEAHADEQDVIYHA